MTKTPNAGSTARGSILGRRKRVLPEPALSVTLWQRDAAGRPTLVRCPLSEAREALSEDRKSAARPALAECGNEHIKSRRNARVPGGRKSDEPSPHCRYCGAASAYPWGAPQICTPCEKIRDRHETAATIQTIADKMRADPSLSWSQARDSGMWIGDDKLHLRVQRTLANRERAAAVEQFAKHGPGRLEREGPAVKVSEAVARAKRAARANFRKATELREAAE
jgi:hypothetical protein